MSFFCDLRILAKKLASRLATQRKSLRKFNLRRLATTGGPFGQGFRLSSLLGTVGRRPLLTVLVWDVKEPTHCSKRVVPGVMGYHLVCSGGTCVSYFLSNKIVNCVAAICAHISSLAKSPTKVL